MRQVRVLSKLYDRILAARGLDWSSELTRIEFCSGLGDYPVLTIDRDYGTSLVQPVRGGIVLQP
jgi:hypothetical protein